MFPLGQPQERFLVGHLVATRVGSTVAAMKRMFMVCSWLLLVGWQGGATIAVAQETVTVREGESLERIARRLQVEGGTRSLAAFNNITNPNLLRPGMVLRIPPRDAGSSSSPTPTPASRTPPAPRTPPVVAPARPAPAEPVPSRASPPASALSAARPAARAEESQAAPARAVRVPSTLTACESDPWPNPDVRDLDGCEQAYCSESGDRVACACDRGEEENRAREGLTVRLGRGPTRKLPFSLPAADGAFELVDVELDGDEEVETVLVSLAERPRDGDSLFSWNVAVFEGANSAPITFRMNDYGSESFVQSGDASRCDLLVSEWRTSPGTGRSRVVDFVAHRYRVERGRLVGLGPWFVRRMSPRVYQEHAALVAPERGLWLARSARFASSGQTKKQPALLTANSGEVLVEGTLRTARMISDDDTWVLRATLTTEDGEEVVLHQQLGQPYPAFERIVYEEGASAMPLEYVPASGLASLVGRDARAIQYGDAAAGQVVLWVRGAEEP